MTDEYQFWRDALAGKAVAIDEASPQPGYYKLRTALIIVSAVLGLGLIGWAIAKVAI